jgi:hypothetical protein
MHQTAAAQEQDGITDRTHCRFQLLGDTKFVKGMITLTITTLYMCQQHHSNTAPRTPSTTISSRNLTSILAPGITGLLKHDQTLQ